MIDYKLHTNGWTVIIDQIDMSSANQEDINQIAKLVAKNTLVVIRNQNLSVQDEVKVLRMFKDVQEFRVPTADNYISDLAGAVVEGSEDIFLRVSGKKDKNGLVGIAAYECEMVWHCNEPGLENRRPIVWLYSVEGSEGSRTSYTNNILSYNDLDENLKKEIENYHLEIIQEMGLDIDGLETDGELSEYNPPLVKINKGNNKGLYFPMYHIHKIKELDEEKSKPIIEYLRDLVVQEQYVYHHDWKDGDILIGDQDLGIHKRWPFNKITERTLHRACFDYPDQDYTS